MLNLERFRHAWTSGRESQAARLPSWGDGIADQTVSSLYYPAAWETVSQDELIFLMPSLRRARADTNTAAGRLFQRALAARLNLLVRRAEATGNGAAKAIITAIAAAGLVKSMSLEEAFSPQRDASQGSPCGETRDPDAIADPRASSKDSRVYWVFELSVLASLDRAARAAALAPASGSDGAELPSALIASIYSGVNAAYAYPSLECAHELLSVGVWLGYLLSGRRAMMPPFVAERLIAHLGAGPGNGTADTCEALIMFHAEAAAGVTRLLRTAKSVYKSGAPALVRPLPNGSAKLGNPPQWDTALTKFIGGHLEACSQPA
ncbi:hypothetical protein [Hyphomicrobium sp. 1Nfss2.1]|uniref:hypothetical protein n=1 Tax=Hyphomicrobium sp. 1Nfss2.1 TaxID=3413936 RepID=UPI003C7D2357